MIVEEINNIQRKYLTKGQLNLFDENLINQTKSAIQNGLENHKGEKGVSRWFMELFPPS